LNTAVATMAGELHDLSLLIGGLQADVKNLANEVREHKSETTEEHRKVHDIVVASSEAVRNLTAIVAEMKPLTDDYREKRAEARGARRLLIAAYTAAGGSFALGLQWVIRKVGG
jgi:hypothetical protein